MGNEEHRTDVDAGSAATGHHDRTATQADATVASRLEAYISRGWTLPPLVTQGLADPLSEHSLMRTPGA